MNDYAALLRDIHSFKGTHFKQEFNGANCLLTEASETITTLTAKLEQAEADLKFAIGGIEKCCVNCICWDTHCPYECNNHSHWQWKGKSNADTN